MSGPVDEDAFVDVLNDSDDESRKRKENIAPLTRSSSSGKRGKLSRASQDVEEEPREDVSSPQVRSARRKKVAAKKKKGANKALDDEDEEPAPEEDDEEQQIDEEDSSRARKKRISSQFVDDDDDNVADSPELMALLSQPKPMGGGKEGIIQRIVLQNFMNHSNLVVDLGPNINFIVGPNGSGKSAILVGLSLCLGASASFSQRAHTLGQLVKEGQKKAVIEVTLCNLGEEAFKPELYGDSITVERTIVKGGASSYRFLSDRRAVVTKDRAELTGICEQFNLQISNPCIIMMQETSRDFLSNSTPRKKYELFERATQIRDIEDHLQQFMAHITAARETVARKKQLLPKLERQHELVKKEYDDVQHLKAMKDNMVEVKCELVWAQVEEREKRVATLAAKLEEKAGVLDRNEEKIKAARQKLEEKLGRDAELVKQLQDLSAREEELQRQMNMDRDEVTSTKSRQIQVMGLRKVFPKKIEALTRRIMKLDEEIARSKAEARGEEAAELIELARKTGEARERMNELQREMEQVLGESRASEAALEEHRMRRAREMNEARAHEKEIAKCKAQIQNVAAAAKDMSSMWGPNMPRLRDLVERNRSSFQKLPRGPIGAHVVLRPPVRVPEGITPQHVLAFVEFQIEKELESFWCDNHADARVLRRLAESIGMHELKVVTSKFRGSVYQNLQVPPENPAEYVRLFDYVQCPDYPDLLNVLIDTTNIDQAVLARGTTESATSLIHSVPNIHRCYVVTGQATDRVRNTVKYIQFNVIGPGRTPKLSQDRADIKKQLEALLREFTDRKAEADGRFRELERAATALEKELMGFVQKRNRIQDAIARQQQLLSELEAPLRVDNGGRDDLEVTRNDLEASLQKLREEERAAVNELEAVQRANEAAESRFKMVEQEMDSISNQRQALQDAARDLQKLVNEQNRKISEGERKVADFRKTLEREREELRVAREVVEQETQKALSVFPNRVEVTKKVSELEAKVNAMERSLAREQQGQRPIEDIERDYAEVGRRMKKITKALKWLDDMLGQLAKALQRRHKKLYNIRNRMSEMVSSFFNGYLTRKGYEGQARFVHDAENPRLDITVNLNPGSQLSQGQDPSTLSGGETSFSTVALLLSLWEVIDTPVRILDEFDIFMDAAHRQISINMLVEFAKLYSTRQFVFLTPLETLGIPTKDAMVRVKRLDPPQRQGQRPITGYLGQGNNNNNNE